MEQISLKEEMINMLKDIKKERAEKRAAKPMVRRGFLIALGAAYAFFLGATAFNYFLVGNVGAGFMSVYALIWFGMMAFFIKQSDAFKNLLLDSQTGWNDLLIQFGELIKEFEKARNELHKKDIKIAAMDEEYKIVQALSQCRLDTCRVQQKQIDALKTQVPKKRVVQSKKKVIPKKK